MEAAGSQLSFFLIQKAMLASLAYTAWPRTEAHAALGLQHSDA